jgi:hypothetical protein
MRFFQMPAKRVLLTCAFLLWGCKSGPSQPTERIELRKLGGELIELWPLAGLPPNCLVFSISQGGVVRQLTKNAEGTSVGCPPGQAIGGHPFQIPGREGKVRIYAIFSDQKLAADPIAEQVVEHGKKADFSVLDLRAPGRLVTDMVQFVPDEAPSTMRDDR